MFFRKLNIFTILIVIAAVGCVLRFVNIATFDSKSLSGGGIIVSAHAVEDASSPDKKKDENQSALRNMLEKSLRATEQTFGQPGAQNSTSGQSSETLTGGVTQPPLPPPPLEAHAFSETEIEALQLLAKRRDTLDIREKSLIEKEALLQAAEKEISDKVAELNKLKIEIERLLGQQQTMQEERIASLVKIYEGMKPKEAATIFNTLDMDVLLPVISRMSERKSSPVLASMDPEKARVVTIKLALQKKLPAAETAADSAAP